MLCKPTSISFPWKIIWIWKIPPRVAFFSWTAELGKILSIDKLWKRSIIVYRLVCNVQTKWGKHGPSASTLSYSFRVVVFGLHWVMPKRVKDLLASWQGSFGLHRNVVIWKMVLHCVMWCIWRERNARSFEGCEQSSIKLKSFFLTPWWIRLELYNLFLFFIVRLAWAFVIWEASDFWAANWDCL